MSPQIPTQHLLTIRVRYQETDAMARLHHANYLTYFELGRTELLRAGGVTYREVEQSGIYLVVAEMNVQYLLPAAYDDELTITTTVISAKGARIRHRYHVHRGTDLLATGESVIAAVDPTGKVKRLPDWLLISHPMEPAGG
jgi:acyl-CoA thioester hydrolase